ncbi:hypothetical protein TNCV_496601 [Trichonephila clavipes]|nr:hypothetical protein TNCV_496601 [Trichonephila clavipes]
MKSFVYASPVDYDEAVVAWIAVVAGDIREMHGLFAKVQQSLRQRCEACILAGGSSCCLVYDTKIGNNNSVQG